MRRVARDDEEALAELVAALAPSLLRFVRRTLGLGRHEAEDLVQEAFVRLWKARRRWRPEATVRGYAFTIVSRLCLNYARGLRRAPAFQEITREDGEPLAAVADGSAGPLRLFLSREIGEAVDRELAALPPSQRAALLLRHSEGLSYQEIASALDVSEAAAESLLSRGRARLRERLAHWVTEGNGGGRG